MMLHKGVFILYLYMINLLMRLKIKNVYLVCNDPEDFAKVVIHYSRRFKQDYDIQSAYCTSFKIIVLSSTFSPFKWQLTLQIIDNNGLNFYQLNLAIEG